MRSYDLYPFKKNTIMTNYLIACYLWLIYGFRHLNENNCDCQIWLKCLDVIGAYPDVWIKQFLNERLENHCNLKEKTEIWKHETHIWGIGKWILLYLGCDKLFYIILQFILY